MSKIMVLAACLAALLAAAMAWVRLAPSDPARWHVELARAAAPGPGPCIEKIETGKGFARASCIVAQSPASVLQALDAIALATPRTARLAGSPQDGRITWITRSRLWGFPDYTTAQAVETAEGTQLDLLARLRFGRGDMGVNGARLRNWLGQLGS